ncbi:alkaline phosphatase D family protein [Arthrobacter sp. SD76]|uniref:DUF7800 domain-containing protein n=1 Tax=Arthrobacter sp. SD76 TaxID=3415007 RepID=UPI003C749BD3
MSVHAGGRQWTASTFAVHGHHYALVDLHGLEPGTVTPYSVEVDGSKVWPEPEHGFPPPVVATLKPGKPLRLAYGSCRTSVPHDSAGNRTHGVDALRAYALKMISGTDERWPDLVVFLGDQVYADLTSEQMQEFIKSRRDISEPPGEELQDYEEYAHLYYLAWSDPANRWLLSTLPSAMIFDDHDIRDDWNASRTWREEMQQKPWWHQRIVAGLASYWVYQHLGNLSPQDRAADPVWQVIAGHHGDGEPDVSRELDRLAERADREPESYRWSFCRDFGDTRLIVVDSRAARNLAPDRRALLDDVEMAWLDDRMQGGFRHLLVGTSLPFLLPMGLHHLESWDEAISEGAWAGSRPAQGKSCGRLSTWSTGVPSKRASGGWRRWPGRWRTAGAARHRKRWRSSPATSTSPTSPRWNAAPAAGSSRPSAPPSATPCPGCCGPSAPSCPTAWPRPLARWPPARPRFRTRDCTGPRSRVPGSTTTWPASKLPPRG